MFNWTATGVSGFAQADWEALSAGAAAPQQVVPVFADLPDPRDAPDLVTDLETLGAVLPPSEVERLASETDWRATTGAPRQRVRLVVYLRRSLLPALTGMGVQVLQVGAAVPAVLPGPPPADPGPDAQQGMTGGPILAVIDDGIPFLNARFRQAPDRTRFHAVWLQADERSAPGQVEIGRVLRRADIDAMLLAGPEAAHYTALSRALLPANQRGSTVLRASHGAHVLDVAAGAAPVGADPMRSLGLLAVQLPPEAVRATGGRRLDGFVVMGLRWLVSEALRLKSAGQAVPLVVTLSIGALSARGDRSGFVADWIAHEVDSYKRLSGADLHLFSAYGNAHRERLVARSELGRGRALGFDWCVQPDDHSPSFLEIHPERATGLGLELVAPDGRVAPLTLTWAQARAGRVLMGPSGPLAAVLPDGAAGSVMIALAPTRRQDAGAVSPHGRWRVRVTSGPNAAKRAVVARVQRDDTPAGYRIMGRQSWLDHADAWGWDFQTRNWIRPLAADMTGGTTRISPVMREGTAISHAGAESATVRLVGSVKPQIGKPLVRVSSLYSAEGIAEASDLALPGESAGPSLVALADDGSNLFGRRGTGVLSGSVVRLSGTSVAAPGAARAKLLWLAGGSVGPDPVPGPGAGVKHPLTGWGVLPGQVPYTAGSVRV